MEIEFEKKLVEEAVFSFLEKENREGRNAVYLQFRSRWNSLYAVSDEQERENQFAVLALETFRANKLDRALSKLLERFPHIRKKAKTLLVRQAHRKSEEGADLFVKDGLYTVVVRSSLERFLDENQWITWMTEHFFRIEDVLDPAFGYRPADFSQARLGPRTVIIEERYRLLWQEEARRRTQEPAAPRKTHAQLLAAARSNENPERKKDCQLCRFPTQDWMENPARSVLDAIAADFPAWNPADGICRRCGEVYEAKMKGFYAPFPGIA